MLTGKGARDFLVHKPYLPEQFGVHHSKVCQHRKRAHAAASPAIQGLWWVRNHEQKAMCRQDQCTGVMQRVVALLQAFVVEYDTGLRVIVHTANLIYCDCNNKSQVNMVAVPRSPAHVYIHLLLLAPLLQLDTSRSTFSNFGSSARVPGHLVAGFPTQGAFLRVSPALLSPGRGPAHPSCHVHLALHDNRRTSHVCCLITSRGEQFLTELLLSPADGGIAEQLALPGGSRGLPACTALSAGKSWWHRALSHVDPPSVLWRQNPKTIAAFATSPLLVQARPTQISKHLCEFGAGAA